MLEQRSPMAQCASVSLCGSLWMIFLLKNFSESLPLFFWVATLRCAGLAGAAGQSCRVQSFFAGARLQQQGLREAVVPKQQSEFSPSFVHSNCVGRSLLWCG